jgi:hypothetical protein
LRNADVLISAPGRTTFHEAYHLRKLPILLPEQHYGQHVNLKRAESTGLGVLSLPLGSMVDLPMLPPSHPKATHLIMGQLRNILTSKDLFHRFDGMLRGLVQRVRALDGTARRQLLDKIEPFVTGGSFNEAVHSIVAENAQVRRKRYVAYRD